MKDIVLIGSGKWGQNYIKTFNKIENAKLIVANRNNWEELIKTSNGVIIATPPDSHIDIAIKCLEYQKPIMIEKPLALSLKDANRLNEYSLPILVNHIHLFSKGYQHIKNTIDPTLVIKILTQVNNNSEPRFYSDLYDYGCHDIALVLDFLGKEPANVINNKCKIKNTIHFKLEFDSCVSESFINSKSSLKDRIFSVFTEDNYSYYNDGYRPKEHPLPLTEAINVFLNAIDGKNDYRIGLNLSFKVLSILDKLSNLSS